MMRPGGTLLGQAGRRPCRNPHRACRTQCNERWIASRPNSSGPAEKHPTITSRCSSANKCGPRGRSCDWSWKPQRTTRCNARISATSPPPADRPLNLPCRNTRGVDYSSTRYQPSSLRACTQVLRGAGRDQARVSSTLIPAMAARADPPRFLDAHHRTPRYAPSQKRLPNLAGCMGPGVYSVDGRPRSDLRGLHALENLECCSICSRKAVYPRGL